MLNDYDGRFTVAEVGGPDPLTEMKAFTAGGKRLDSAYNFDFLYAPDLTADRVRASLNQWDGTPEEGWPSWAFSNHDAPRSITRWSTEQDRGQIARLSLLLLLSLRGNPIIYQGEELGLPQGFVPFEDLLDPEAIANWPHTLGRDGARTPIPWEANAPQAGFSQANRTWLKVDQDHTPLAIDKQITDPGSMISYTRRLLAQRQALTALVSGSSALLDTPDEVVAFIRSGPDGDVLCAFNLADYPVDWSPLPTFTDAKIIANERETGSGEAIPTRMERRSGYWAVTSGG